MREFQRIYGKKTLMLFFLLLVINTGIFIFGANPDKNITLMGEPLEQYIEEYPEFLSRTVRQGRARTGIRLFSQGFASEVTEKSVQRYETLTGILPKAGDNRGIVLFLQSHIFELLALFFMLHIVSSMFDERKKGLSNMVRATVNGRLILYLERAGIILFTAFTGTTAFMGSNLIGASVTFGMDDLLRPLQSLPEYQKCPYSISVFEYLLLLNLLKAMGIFLAGLFMYVLKGLVNGFLFYVLMGGLMIGELCCGMLIPPVSSINLLRYINLYTVIRTEDFFTGCVYLNISGHAVDGAEIACIVFGAVFLVLVSLGFLVHGKRYAVGTRGGERLGRFIGRIREKTAFQHTLFGWECYKLFIKQGAVIFITVCLCIHIEQSAKYRYYYPVDANEKLYYMKYSGEVTEKKLKLAENWMRSLKDSELFYKNRLEEIQNAPTFNSKGYADTSSALAANRYLQQSFAPVYEDLRGAYEYTQRTGKSVSLIEPYAYDFLLNHDEQTRQRASFLSIAAIIGALAGIYAFERHTNMEQMINSSCRGKLVAKRVKPILIVIISFTCAILFSLVQMINIERDIGFSGLDLPAQGLRFFNDFSIYISVRWALILLLAVRGLFGLMIGVLTAAFSRLGDDKFTVICNVAIVLVIWVILTNIIPGTEFMNPINLLGYTRV